MISYPDLTSFGNAIAAGEISSAEATQQSIDALRDAGQKYGCVIRIDEDAAMAIARQCDAELADGKVRGPLHGVPMAHKDMFDRAGHVSHCGSRLFSTASHKTATVIGKLDQAGAIDIGRLHMTEFAVSAIGFNDHFGDCANPTAPGRISGGSSSGTAAAVAFGAIPAGLGSDTGGSIRIPASFCGLVGLKPTFGRVSRAGAAPLAASVDVVGPIGRTVADVAVMMRVISGHDQQDAASSHLPVPSFAWQSKAPSTPVRFGVLAGYFAEHLDTAVAKVIDDTIGRLTDMKGIVRTATFERASRCARHAGIVARGEAASLHGPFLREQRSLYGTATWERLTGDLLLPAAVIEEARRSRAYWLRDFMTNVFKDNDALVCATVPIEAPLVEDCLEGSPKRKDIVSKLGWNTRLFNYLGLPAITIPMGRTAAGTPVGVQLVGRPFGEDRLLRISNQIMTMALATG